MLNISQKKWILIYYLPEGPLQNEDPSLYRIMRTRSKELTSMKSMQYKIYKKDRRSVASSYPYTHLLRN